MALSLERFFHLMFEVVPQARQADARREMTQQAFWTWVQGQQLLNETFRAASFQVDKKNAHKLRDAHRKALDGYPKFSEFLKTLKLDPGDD